MAATISFVHELIAALTSAWLVAGMLFVGGCAADGLPLVDMAVATPDAAAGTPGIGLAKLGCGGLVGCYNDCATTATTPNEYETCTASCDKQAKKGAPAVYAAALACGEAHCLGDVDAGSGKCLLATDGKTLTNANGSMIASTDPGTPPRACGACLNNALAALFGTTCAPAASPDCNPLECQALTAACLNDF